MLEICPRGELVTLSLLFILFCPLSLLSRGLGLLGGFLEIIRVKVLHPKEVRSLGCTC